MSFILFLSSAKAGELVLNYRDRNAFAALVAALDATDEFSSVLFPAAPESSHVVAEGSPLGMVMPWRWMEVVDDSSGGISRTVQYFLTLVARADDANDRFQTLDRLTSIAQNAVEGQTLGGACLPSLTQLRIGEFDSKSPNPESRALLRGTFTYMIGSPTAHDTTP